jgi:hypothetical protein
LACAASKVEPVFLSAKLFAFVEISFFLLFISLTVNNLPVASSYNLPPRFRSSLDALISFSNLFTSAILLLFLAANNKSFFSCNTFSSVVKNNLPFSNQS